MSTALTTIQYHESVPAFMRTGAPPAANAGLAAGFDSKGFARVSTKDNRFSLVSVEGDVYAVNQVDAGISFIDIAIVRSHPGVTKTYYASAYNGDEGVAPTCFSNDGIVPDNGSEAKQSAACAGCRHNAFGSADNGKGKACQDAKRTAIFLAADTPVVVNGAAQVLSAFSKLYGYKLPPLTAKDAAREANEIAGFGADIRGVKLRARFVSQGVVNFKRLAYLTEGQYQQALLAVDTEEAVLMIGLDGKPQVQPAPLGAPPVHMQAPASQPAIPASPSSLPASAAAAPASETASGSPQTAAAPSASNPFPSAAPAAATKPARPRGRPVKGPEVAAAVAQAETPFPPAQAQPFMQSAAPSPFPQTAAPSPVIQQVAASSPEMDALLAAAMA